MKMVITGALIGAATTAGALAIFPKHQTSNTVCLATPGFLHLIESAVRSYEMDMGAPPHKLTDLIAEESSDRKYKGPYLGTDAVPKDGWDEEFIYVCPGHVNKEGYDLFSKGPDKKAYSEDDIANHRKQLPN